MARREFKYEDDDPDAIKAAAEKRGGYDTPVKEKFKKLVIKAGKHRLRILPRTWKAEDGPKHWAFPVFIHYGIGAEGTSFLCALKMNKGDCPICAEMQRLHSEGDEEGAKELRPASSYVCWVIDRNHEESGPQVYFMPAAKVYAPINDASRDVETGELLQITNPEKGHDVLFNASGTGRNMQYDSQTVSQKRTFLNKDTKTEDEWLDFITENPIPSVLRFYPAEYIQKVFGGTTSRERTNDEAPRTRARRDEPDDSPPPRSRRAEPEEEPRRSRRAEPEEEPAPRSARRERSAEPEDDIDAPRSRRAEPEEEPRRSRRAEPEEEERPSRRRAEPEEEEPSRGRRSSERGAPGDDDPPRRTVREEAPEGLSRRTRREPD